MTSTGRRVELHHGGHEAIQVIRDSGLFCSPSRRSAESHGPVVTTFELSDDEMLSNYALNYEIDAIDAIREVLAAEIAEGSDIDRAWEIVVESAGCVGAEDEIDMFRADDRAEAGWEAQRIRGRVAAALGYRAIEMEDEHGTSWLVVR